MGEGRALGPGRLFEVATGAEPVPAIVAEQVFTEDGVDREAATGVGLLVSQPGVGLGRKGHRCSHPAALRLVAGRYLLPSLLDAAKGAPRQAPSCQPLGRNGKNDV